MGLTATVVQPQGYQRPEPLGHSLYFLVVDIAFDSSYPTGGEALAPATLGLREILGVMQLSKDVDFPGHDVIYIAATDLLLAYDDEGVEVANTTNLSTFAPRCLVVGY